MIKQHRIVNDLLKEEIKGMHGLQVSFQTCSSNVLRQILMIDWFIVEDSSRINRIEVKCNVQEI